MFQKSVPQFKDFDIGKPGDIAKGYPGFTTESCAFWHSGQNLQPGDFVVGSVDNTTKRISYAEKCVGNVANKVFLGVVTAQSIKQSSVSPTSGFQQGHLCTYVVQGYVFIKATADADDGKWLLIKEADGSQVYDKDRTKASHVRTDWQVHRGGKKDQIIIIKKV